VLADYTVNRAAMAAQIHGRILRSSGRASNGRFCTTVWFSSPDQRKPRVYAQICQSGSEKTSALTFVAEDGLGDLCEYMLSL